MLAADEAIGPRVATLISRSAHDLVAIATPPSTVDNPRSLPSTARSLAIPCLDARRLDSNELVDEIRSVDADVLVNVHSLTKVSTDVLDLFAVGAWNLHPGPLPEGAGANVPSWAIALGWESHGVTLHKMTAEYDDGHISFEDRFRIAPNATGLTLSAECSRRGLGLLAQLLEALESPATVPAVPQDPSQRRYFGRKQPHDGIVAWSWPASQIEAYVRACDFRPFPSPWAPPQAKVGATVYELLSVEVGEHATEPAGSIMAGDSLSVASADRWVTLTEVREVET